MLTKELLMSKTISASDFDLLPGEADCTAALERLARHCCGRNDITVEFSPGRYNISPSRCRDTELYVSNHDPLIGRRVAMLFENCSGLTLRGNGAQLIAREYMVPIIFDRCRDVRVEGFAIDWDRPLHAWAEVLGGWSASVPIRIDPQFVWRIHQGQLEFRVGDIWEPLYLVFGIDRKTMCPADGSGDNLGCGWGVPWLARQGDDGVVVLQGHAAVVPPVGDIVILRFGRRFAPGIVASEVRNITLSDVTLHHAGGMGLLAQRCTNPTLERFNITPSHARPLSVCQDATHFVGCRGTVTLRDCLLEHQLDDCINIHGIYQPIVEMLSDGCVVRYVHDQQRGNIPGEAGDTMTVIDPQTLLPRDRAILKGVRRISAEFQELVFDGPLPESMQPGMVIENQTWKPDVEIAGCTMGHNRARGILLAAGETTRVEGNTFNSPGAAIRMHGDSNYWFESGAMGDVLIRNNHFNRCGYSHFRRWGKAVIMIDPEMSEVRGPYHRRIEVSDNTFTDCQLPWVDARAVGELVVKDNRGQGEVLTADCEKVVRD